jgi:hypothetical protein
MTASVIDTTTFLAAATEAFGFLLTDFGFSLSRTEHLPLRTFPRERHPIAPGSPEPLTDRAVVVEFSSPQVTATLTNDPRGELQVTLSLREGNQAVDLWHVLEFQKVPNVPNGWLYEWGNTSLAAQITALASALDKHGRPWLQGDRDAWAKLWSWRAQLGRGA